MLGCLTGRSLIGAKPLQRACGGVALTICDGKGAYSCCYQSQIDGLRTLSGSFFLLCCS